jgi:hypothetical protein
LDTSRVSLGEMLAAAGGLVLLVCMFLPWFDGSLSRAGRPTVSEVSTGWEAYGGVFDVLIVVLALVPVAIAIRRAGAAVSSRLPLEQGALVLGAGALLIVIVAVRLLDPPDVLEVPLPGLDMDSTRKPAAFLALLAAAAVAFGGYVQRATRGR